MFKLIQDTDKSFEAPVVLKPLALTIVVNFDYLLREAGKIKHTT